MKDLFHKLKYTQRILGVLGLILTVLPLASWAQENEISIQASVDKTTITIGDVITYTLTITYSPEMAVYAPRLEDQLGQFEIRDQQVLPERKLDDGLMQRDIRYLVSTFTIGELEIPSVVVPYIDLEGQEKTIACQAIAIAVESLNPDQAGDIKDIKPPVNLPGALPFLSWLIAGLVLLAVGTALFLYLRKRRLRQALGTIEYQGPPRPAHEIALEELNRIASLNLIQRGLIKQFYTEIAEAIKRYIGRRYNIQTMELTTFELTLAMEEASVPGEHVGMFNPFFQECDLVKFAKHIPARERIDGALEEARQLVLATREVLVATPSETSCPPMSQVVLANSPQEGE